MVVVIADYLPPAVRGRMKLWFVEPRPNIFVSGIKDSVADDVVDFLYKKCPVNSGLIIFQRINKPPGFRIRGIGDPKRPITEISGMQLIIEKMGSLQPPPQ